MRNLTTLILCIYILVFSSCVTANENTEKKTVSKQNDVKKPININKVQNNIQNNNNLVKKIEDDINALLQDF